MRIQAAEAMSRVAQLEWCNLTLVSGIATLSLLTLLGCAEQHERLGMHVGNIVASAADKSETTILCVNHRGRVWRWRLSDGGCDQSFVLPGCAEPVCLGIEANARRVAYLDVGGTGRIYDTETVVERAWVDLSGWSVNGMAISDGHLLVWTGKSVSVCKIPEMDQDATPEQLSMTRLENTTQGEHVAAATTTPSGFAVLISGSSGGIIQFIDVGDGLHTIRSLPVDIAGNVDSFAISSDGSRLALVSSDSIDSNGGVIGSTLRVIDAMNGSSVVRVSVHGDTVEALTFGDGGKAVLTGGYDGWVREWDAVDLRMSWGRSGFGAIRSLAVIKAVNQIAVGDSHRVTLIDDRTGEGVAAGGR